MFTSYIRRSEFLNVLKTIQINVRQDSNVYSSPDDKFWSGRSLTQREIWSAMFFFDWLMDPTIHFGILVFLGNIPWVTHAPSPRDKKITSPALFGGEPILSPRLVKTSENAGTHKPAWVEQRKMVEFISFAIVMTHLPLGRSLVRLHSLGDSR